MLRSLIAVCFALIATSLAAGDGVPPFKITANRADDQVAVNFEKDKAIFSVHSPFGISQATIEEAGKQWPDAVVLRLHLKGLENFKITNGNVTVEGSASLQDGKQHVRLWQDGKEDSPLDAKSLHWIHVRIFSNEGKLAKELPINDGYFELMLPKAMFEGSRKITVSWIDFYRN